MIGGVEKHRFRSGYYPQVLHLGSYPEATCLHPVHRVGQVVQPESVGGPLALLRPLVAQKNHVRGLETLHRAHVLPAHNAPILQ